MVSESNLWWKTRSQSPYPVGQLVSVKPPGYKRTVTWSCMDSTSPLPTLLGCDLGLPVVWNTCQTVALPADHVYKALCLVSGEEVLMWLVTRYLIWIHEWKGTVFLLFVLEAFPNALLEEQYLPNYPSIHLPITYLSTERELLLVLHLVGLLQLPTPMAPRFWQICTQLLY